MGFGLPVLMPQMRGTTVRLKKTAVMVGMMGAGKTAVGTAVARMLDVPFLDSDEEIVKAANRSIAENISNASSSVVSGSSIFFSTR